MSDNLLWNYAAGRKAGTTGLTLVVRWLWVAVPLAWGILATARATLAFFR